VAGGEVAGIVPALRSRDPEALVAASLNGDRAALARVLSMVERGDGDARVVARLIHPHTGGAHTVGITGAPGAGKSSLTNRLIAAARTRDGDVAVLAVDPSSPFTGGAILGDRVRMQDHALDAHVFIRSMASRGHLGGLSLATREAIRVLDAAGFPLVLIETVGVGQVEVEIAGAADTTVVVVNPGWGDAVQANKAGLLEIADVFVINKAERPGADQTQRDLEDALTLATRERHRPVIVRTSATTGEGVEELVQAIRDHRRWLAESGELERRRSLRLDDELRDIVVRRLEQRVREAEGGEAWDHARASVAARDVDPWTAADRLLKEI
jgi:LAO/AO transport system kinase